MTLILDRKKTHGSAKVTAAIAQSQKALFRSAPNWEKLSPLHQSALDMIAEKAARILSGDPTFKDHWDDIAGYAHLVSQGDDE